MLQREAKLSKHPPPPSSSSSMRSGTWPTSQTESHTPTPRTRTRKLECHQQYRQEISEQMLFKDDREKYSPHQRESTTFVKLLLKGTIFEKQGGGMNGFATPRPVIAVKTAASSPRDHPGQQTPFQTALTVTKTITDSTASFSPLIYRLCHPSLIFMRHYSPTPDPRSWPFVFPSLDPLINIH